MPGIESEYVTDKHYLQMGADPPEDIVDTVPREERDKNILRKQSCNMPQYKTQYKTQIYKTIVLDNSSLSIPVVILQNSRIS